MRRPMRHTAIALLTSLLALTACSSGGSSTSSTSATPNEADVVAWMDKVCGAVGGTVKAMSDEPSIDMNDPSKLKTGLSDWLGTRVAAVDKSIADLKALENGPHPKSKELVTAAEDGMGQIRTLLSDTKSKLDSSNDPTQVVAAFTEMVTKAAALETTGADVQKKFDETGLAPVAQKAANCKDLQISTSSAPTS
ncbi:hypothetical protein C8D88_1011063 [Lentzea atacamensis]|uniref:Small secreted protein n=2 Tax=Lentzea TaxID=165301 RepID=A0A316IDP6_9PSEU|nr:hypothetical protein [Lentzea atacamensis]PWK91033.1 hypothetical protein C8D88_1011063 [Lentzea atacamensis]RAS60301.1 hypothetical protein C8D87_112198 [Lentzea atacamensis]